MEQRPLPDLPLDADGETVDRRLELLPAPEGVEDDEDLAAWVARGVAYARSLPPKA
jgi:hypothetical protein